MLIAGGYFFVFNTPDYLGGHPLCLFKNLFRIACPGCGMSRATLELVKGNVMASFRYHILCIPFSLGLVLSTGWMLSDFCLNRDTFFLLMKRELRWSIKVSLLLLILLSWGINISRGI